ncbi:thioredoxin H2-2 [Typha angustifolia]|uniref:thioredoxin H2-2 n=1 Tax=Typha angustifolia TaxID=59011 RepID=UPI003C30A422
MGSFFSTPAASRSDEGESAVIAIHSADRFNEQFQASKDSNKLMVIDFSASWCGPCRFIEPAFKALAAKFTDAVFVKIDVDELSEVSRKWRVEAMPTFVLVKGGQEVSRVVGAKKDELERKIHMFST